MTVAQARSLPASISKRTILLGLFLIFTFPILPALASSMDFLDWLFAADLFVRSIPLSVAWCVDVAFYDAGELSHALIPLWVLLTGLLLSPLLLLAIWPTIWLSHKWRVAITRYAVVAGLATVLAAIWVFTHLGIFF